MLPRFDRLSILALDVKDPQSIREVIDAAGPIDVLVNNAGIGFLSALEGTPMDTVRDIFETNTLGTIAVTQASNSSSSTCAYAWCCRDVHHPSASERTRKHA